MLLRGKYKIRKDKSGIDKLVIFDLNSSIRNTVASRSYKRLLLYLPVYELYSIKINDKVFHLYCNKNNVDFICDYILNGYQFQRYRTQLANYVNYPWNFWYEYQYDFMIFTDQVDIELLHEELRKNAKEEVRLVVPISKIKVGTIFSTIEGFEYLKVTSTDYVSLREYFNRRKVELLNWDSRTPVMKLNQELTLRKLKLTSYDIQELILRLTQTNKDHNNSQDDYLFATEFLLTYKRQELPIDVISLKNLFKQDYKIMALPTWISFNETTKKFTVTENTTGSQRQGTITLTQTTSNKSIEMIIKQLSKSYVFAFKTTAPTPNVPAYKATANTLNLATLEAQIDSYLLGTAADPDAHVTKGMTWAIKSQSVAGTATISGKVVTFAENENNAARTIVVEATQAESGRKLQVTITQAAATWEYTFTCASEEISINYAAQEIDPKITSTKLINGHKTVEVGYTVVEE